MAAHCWEWHNDTTAKLDPPLPVSVPPPRLVHRDAQAIADAIRAARP